MSGSSLTEAYEKALKLPEPQQEAAAGLLEDFVRQQSSAFTLSDSQLAELRRRLADPTPEHASDEDVEAFYKRGVHED